MDEDTHPILETVAGLVADSGSPDWESLTRENEGLADTLRILRRIQEIAERHRGSSSPDAMASIESGADDKLPNAPQVPFAWGPLEVREKLGGGSSGDLYRAFDPKLQRDVALKLRPADFEQSDRSLAEARRLARVRHPNVVSVHGADVFDGMAGIWTDLLRGQTLEEKLRREGPLAATEAAWIGSDLCRALSAVHEASLVHGDLKAANVMREPDGTIVLLDFGSARVFRDVDASESALVRFGDRDLEEPISGTPLMMAPEVLLGTMPTASADLYALGVLLYWLTSGEYPVGASSLEELIKLHCESAAVPLGERRADLPSAFVEIVECALHRNPEERFTSAREMEQCLSRFLESRIPSGRVAAGSGASPNNLPRDVSSFVGRERQISELKSLLHERRLVSLTGTGGAGKTRLALQTASSLMVGAFDEIRLVELAAIEEPARILAGIAEVFGLRQTPRQSWFDMLVDRIGDRSVLLVLDNCEHLIDGCAGVVTALLRSLPGLTILTTSREALGVAGEMNYPVPPLQLPNETIGGSLAEIRAIESISLFVERAMATGGPFVFDATTVPTIARICRRLDGIPLAIELAAARVRVLSLSQISDRLDDRFRLLTAGSRSLPRHQTLSALLDWSHDLLSERERILFRRLSVFVGGWSLEAAEAVGASSSEVSGASGASSPIARETVDGSRGIAKNEILYLLGHLVDKSLVERDLRPALAETRYRMLETVHAYAKDRLERAGETVETTLLHRAYFAALAEDAAKRLRTEDEVVWLKRIDGDSENLRAALERSLEADADLETGLRFTSDIERLWSVTGKWNEARHYVRCMLERPGARGPLSAGRFRALTSAGNLAGRQDDFLEAEKLHAEASVIALALHETGFMAESFGNLGADAYHLHRYSEAMDFLRKSASLARQIGDKQRLITCLLNMGNVLEIQGAAQDAVRTHKECLSLARHAGDRRGIAHALGLLSGHLLREGRFLDARRSFEESLAIRRELGDRWGIAVGLIMLGEAHRRCDDVHQALSSMREGTAILRELSDRTGLMRAAQMLADAALAARDQTTARAAARESLAIAHRLEARGEVCASLCLLARASLQSGELERAARILGASETFATENEGTWKPEGAGHEREEVVGSLGESAAELLIAEGRAMSERAALDYALREP